MPFTWSLTAKPAYSGWKMRILSGTSIGREINLTLAQYTLGSGPAALIGFPDPSIAPLHLVMDLRPGHIELKDTSGRPGVKINGSPLIGVARIASGDCVEVGKLKFQLIATAPPASAGARS